MKRLMFGAAQVISVALAGLVFAAVGATDGALAQTKNLSIVTGGTGGVYYPLGGGLANLLTKHVPGWQATAEVTGGSVDNLKLLGAKRADIAFSMADASLDASRGEDKFKGNVVNQRTLAVLYPNIMHVVTTEASGIKTMADLKGKRVSTGSPGSATEVMAFRVLEAAGIDKDKDLRRERLGAAESTNAVKDNKIDAYFWVGGLPTSAVTDLGATPGVKLKLVDHSDVVEKMNAKYGPLYAKGTIPASMYPGQATPNAISSVWNILVVSDAMPDDVAYNIVKTIFEKRDEWATVHAEAKNVKLENQLRANTPVPFHPGAIKYMAEKGVKIDPK
ncbi:MAG: TAXI family TRAP transporter solute-binding subunit [Ferrovibrio sp.]|uniref:TAXI family TRAP transporter solute-binding subunit n=1 Tax=Ferrovibrio sp. TaxID=1917215 RepID=UPI0026386DAF|nr:TAXI family TRAP transporter solute-binding subunit [Ferrovibrio sp.]MCW0236576.1 TAXI family TRAP transporter solute-binding subunit [Ferrovibrio sp.]